MFVKVIVVNMEDQSRFGKTEKLNEKSSSHLVYEDDELPDRLVGYSLLLPRRRLGSVPLEITFNVKSSPQRTLRSFENNLSINSLN